MRRFKRGRPNPERPGADSPGTRLAILTALTLRAVFRLALRQTEGLIGSLSPILLGTAVELGGTMMAASGWRCATLA